MMYAGLVLKNLFRNKRRTLLTIFSIAVSLFIFSALISLPIAATEILSSSASSVRILTHNKAGLAYSLPEAYRQKIAAIPHVEAVVSESWFGGIYHDVNDQFPNLAVDADQADMMWPDWGISREQFVEFKRLRTACIVGPATMQRFHLHIGQQIMLRGTLYPFSVTLKIVGVSSGTAPPNFLFFRRDYLEEAAGRPGWVAGFWVRVDSSAAVGPVIAAIDRQFADSSGETQSESEAAFLNSFLDNFRMVFRLAEILGIIVLVTIGLVAANTAAMSIRERRGEIAVMRSLGFPGATIIFLLLAESALIGLAGGLLGCGAGYLVLKVFAIQTENLAPLAAIRMSPIVIAETLVIAVAIGFLSALIPARAAARHSIVETLRAVA